ncbi:MAG: serine protease [Acidimicrobiales bacterium]|nr:serine protease [Acidimicrobiales bacterium]
MTRFRFVGLLTLIAGLALAGCSSSPSTGTASGSTSTSLGTTSAAASSGSALQTAYVDVVNKVRPSVVEISTPIGLGSGVVFDEQGNIVTNNHVVAGATQFQVTFSDGQTAAAALVGTYPPEDLAVIRANRTTGLTPATFGDSTKLQIGDITLAIGNPLGLASSVTEGIVSFNGRAVSEDNGVVLSDTVQTSAAINPGNSGGALVDINGQVIGIPTLAATDPQVGGGSAPGIGFALPSSSAKLIAGELISQGKVTNTAQAALGIVGTTAISPLDQAGGVIVRTVQPGSPAAKAGVKPGDIIDQINSQLTPTLSILQGVLHGLKPGDKTSVIIRSASGSKKTVSVTLSGLTG